jgi:hypothetical protein
MKITTSRRIQIEGNGAPCLAELSISQRKN